MENELRFVLLFIFMALPFFFVEKLDASFIILNEETSKHIVQVLRMKIGEQSQLTDGKGSLAIASITDNNRKRCQVEIVQISNIKPANSNITVAISPIKNNSRFEWFLEKATEIGVNTIVPIICSRTEKQHFKFDRMQSILISAMLQSQQAWLPELQQPIKLNEAVLKASQEQKFIAHCEDENNKVQLSSAIVNHSASKLILIGPEGDFTKEEIDLALSNKFTPVALGDTRLRTETAGIVAATLLRLV